MSARLLSVDHTKRAFRSRGAALLIVALACAAITSRAAAQDTVHLRGAGGAGQITVGGRVVEYTGRQLEMELPGGRRQVVPGSQVLDVDTQLGRRQADADAAFARRRFDQALALYCQAIDEEPRAWVRRQILAQMVRCHRALGQWESAGETFLLLLQSDPDTPYFDCIPLAWLPRPPTALMEQSAGQWLARQEPAAELLGASHLLVGPKRAAAIDKLRRLATADDPRVALLATAQVWRTAVATADDAQLETWARAIDRMPEPLRAGPYFVLGSARLQRKRWEAAALALLQAPILYPQERALAARSLVEAGGALEKLDQPADAFRLYRELLRDYPDQPEAVAEAKGRVESLKKSM